MTTDSRWTITPRLAALSVGAAEEVERLDALIKVLAIGKPLQEADLEDVRMARARLVGLSRVLANLAAGGTGDIVSTYVDRARRANG